MAGFTMNGFLFWTLAGVIFGLGGFVVILIVVLIRQRRAEEQLRRANMVVENSPAVLFRWKAAEGWPVELVSANVSRFGYTSEELLSGTVPFSSMVHPDDLERVTSEVAEFVPRGMDRFRQEYRILARDGSVRWVDDRTVVERDEKGRITHYQGIVLDITDRKKAEEELRLAQYCIDNASISIALFDGDRIIKVNDRMCKILGYTADELTGMTLFEIDPRITREKFLELARQIDEVGYNPPFEGWHRRKDGSVFPVELSSNRLKLDGRDLVISFGQDITLRKQAEEALRLSESKYRDIVENAPVGIFRSNLEGKLLSANPAMARILKYDSTEDLIESVNRRCLSETLYSTAGQRETFVDKFPLSREWTIGEVSFHRKDGAVVTLNMHHRSAPAGDADAVEFEGFIEDITERKRAEHALRESEKKFRVLAETAPPAIVLYQGDRFVYVNPAMCAISGYSEEDLLAMHHWEWAPREDWDLIRERGMARLRGEPAPSQYEQRLQTKNGESKWVIISAGNVEYEGKPACIATLVDVTETRHVAEKLRQSETLFSSAFRSSPDAVNINRLEDGLYLDVNDGFCSMTGYRPEEVIGRTSLELNIWVNPKDREYLVRELAGKGFVTNMDAKFRRKDGSVLTGQMSARIVDIEGEPCIVNIVRDVTELKRADEQLRAYLAEKTVLLKEVHHRVKNNLQIISSLLELQSDFIADEESRRFIRESRNRIASMAMVHEKLYHSESVASINLGDYIESLTQYLFSTFVTDTDGIGLTVEVEDIHLAIDEAIPCGLIVNELVSNALKHAFPRGEHGEISVRCRSEEHGWATVTVSDTGIGLPAGFDIENMESLGLQLVDMLVKQLRGTIRLDTEKGGTTVIISFPGQHSPPAR
jgi:PAS domain S-box-containing protein